MNITKQKSDLFVSNDFLSYLVVAYALVTEDLAKYTGQSAIEHRATYLNISQQTFHDFSDEELHRFLCQNYPT